MARNTLLELHAWTFATRRAALALTAEDSFEWAYAYAAPAGAVKILSVLPYEAGATDPSQDYAIEGGEQSKLILSSQESAVVRYVALVTDTTRFSPLFSDALAWLLASYLAGPIIKGDAGMAMGKACYQTFLLTLSQAKTSDASQGQGRGALAHSPEWIKGR